MRYISTRGGITPLSFKETVLMGLAEDGGLILPEAYPAVDEEVLSFWSRLSYPELALEVFSLFVDDIPLEDLRKLVFQAYATFDHPEICPLVRVGPVFILELFHGPTLAFKDIALQFLGGLFEYLLLERGARMNILGATSGDTGSAAIYGVRGRKNINIFILHPHGRVSPVQALQMTTVTDANVFNLAIEGTFDDCQAIVKAIFEDLAFKRRYHLGAVNSINWARVMAQVVYYIWAWLRLAEKGQSAVFFSVPTGNFGDIFAGYVARRILGRERIPLLMLATNENDILTRFVNQGDYSLGKVVSTISPSMDIQVASNFERYLYHLLGEDPIRVREAMEVFSREGRLRFGPEELARVREDFASVSVSQEETRETIASFYQETGYVLDPHTAVGVRAGLRLLDRGHPVVCLATAHPAKFPEAVAEAIGHPPRRPPALEGLEERPRRVTILPADIKAVKEFVAQNALL
ncbi:threonine synthase [Thermosulfuriphilus ammonigenes]|uniref:Threonine synthase n=1 Tax=Thermosulfuriphilus ammonigenes TaxID=1936021 RepID=A0A6G7PVT9_9BACT|nr:threonine synthase [Thermosulfuriphilus ammonigenes]MBA2848117.1 threonine synthase [Thermosulfuriphilus ammonigenes]QIJ71707.1 threonine synthase [Thermosulfuriphilus ammonigenes]